MQTDLATWVPLGDVSSDDAFGGLVPSFAKMESALDQLRGPGRTDGRAQARELESTLGMGLGAFAAGAAHAHGVSMQTAAMAGAAALFFGVSQGHPLLGNIGRGLIAPWLAQLGARTLGPERPAAPVPAAPPAPPAAS